MEGRVKDSNFLRSTNISAEVWKAFWKATDNMMALGLWPRSTCISLMGSQSGPLNLPRCWIKPCCSDVIGQVPEDGALANDGTVSKQSGLCEKLCEPGLLSTHPGALTRSQRSSLTLWGQYPAMVLLLTATLLDARGTRQARHESGAHKGLRHPRSAPGKPTHSRDSIRAKILRILLKLKILSGNDQFPLW